MEIFLVSPLLVAHSRLISRNNTNYNDNNDSNNNNNNHSNNNLVLADLLGPDMFTNSFGLLLLFQGVATLIGPPIVGKHKDDF